MTSQIDELLSRGDPDAMNRAVELRQMYGLDQPLWYRYLHWVSGIFRWDFGLSCQDTVPVSDLIGERLALTIVMETCTIAFIWIVSFVIGVYAATHQYKLGDYVASFIGFVGLSIPNFLLALVLLYVGKVYFGLSIGGLMDPEYIEQPMSLAKAWSVAQHLVIPVIVIGMSGTAGMIRRLRANLLDELQKQYVVTGRAKGLGEAKYSSQIALGESASPKSIDFLNPTAGSRKLPQAYGIYILDGDTLTIQKSGIGKGRSNVFENGAQQGSVSVWTRANAGRGAAKTKRGTTPNR